MRRRKLIVKGALAAFALTGCSAGSEGNDRRPEPPVPSETDPKPTPEATDPTTSPRPPVPPTSRTESPLPPTPHRTPAEDLRFDPAAAYRHVTHLAGRIGPREATSRAYRSAASYVERGFRQAGLRVRSQALRVPAGVSWGIPVPAGRTFNLIAYAPGLDLSAPHIVIGAHLDTVPQAPGAEDNASGVAVLLELARMAGASDPRPPLVLVAFGAEEPRGEGDDRHHYGSKAYLRSLRSPERRAVRQMVSLDRVGVGPPVRIRTAGVSSRQAGPPDPIGRQVEDRLAAAARRVGVLVETGDINRASDHWPFHLAGVPAARVGGNPFAAYHSERDRPDVVSRAQLGRTGRLVWAWLTTAAAADPAASAHLPPAGRK